MIKRLLFTYILIAFITFHIPINAKTLYITPESTTMFHAKHLGKEKVKGTFNNMDGTVTWPLAKQSVINVQIPIATLNTNNKVRDRHLKSKVFFNIKKHPHALFKSNSIVPTKNGYIANGTLYIKETQKEVSLAFQVIKKTTLEDGSLSIHIKGELDLDRRDHKLGFYKKMIGNLIKIDIDVLLTDRSNPQKPVKTKL